MFVWAFAEAIWWPVIPDGLLNLLSVGARRRFWVVLLASILGSATGGTGLYLFLYFGPEVGEALLSSIPFSNKAKVMSATNAIASHGSLAFFWQPISGVALKYYAIVGATSGVSPWTAIPIFIVARGVRMAVTASIFGLVGTKLSRHVRRYWLVLAPIYLSIFLLMWSRVEIW